MKDVRNAVRGIVLMSALTLLSPSLAQAAAPRPARTEDIARVSSLSDLAVSPDGSKAVFQSSDLSVSGDKRETTLWLLDLEHPQLVPLIKGEHGDSRPAWSPNGARIAFLREIDGVSQLHMVSSDGTSVCALTKADGGVEDFHWSPNGKQIAFTTAMPITEDLPPAPPGVRIFNRADYRSYNNYVDDTSLSQIWRLELNQSCDEPKTSQLTKGAVAASFSFWSKDASTIFYTTNDTIEPYYGGGKSSLRSIRIKDGAEKLVMPFVVPGTNENLASAPRLIPSPDGSRFAFTLGNPGAPPDFAQNDIFITDLKSLTTTNVTASYDRDIGGGVVMWKDDRHLIAINNDAGNANLVEVNILTRRVRSLWAGERVVQSFHLSSGTGRLLAIASDFTTPPEVYGVGKSGESVRLTRINAHLQDELTLTRPEAIAYQGPGRETIHGYLHKPPAFDSTKKYPLIVWAHGGPHHWWSSAYDPDIQAMAAAGYLVMYVNPRGSTSYGQAFASALSGSWPGRDFDDVMAGVDYLLRRPYVDAARLGIAGGSSGGILTDWAITQSDRFRAAVSISDIADSSIYWFIGDQPDIADRNTQPWLDEDEKRRSPITHGLNIKTPTLFISGTHDFRTPAAAGGEMMFRLLKYLRVPTALIQFEGAGHMIRSKDPRHRGLSIHYLLRWMNLHLKGERAPEFEVRPANESI